MKKVLFVLIPALLSGCSSILQQLQTKTIDYQCDDKPLSITMGKSGEAQQLSFIYNGAEHTLTQGLSATGSRYTDGVYVFWQQNDKATVYEHDQIIFDNCQLANGKR